MRYTHLRTEGWAERLGYLALNRGWMNGAPQKRPFQVSPNINLVWLWNDSNIGLW